MVFHWNLSNIKSFQVSRTLLHILSISEILLYGRSTLILLFLIPSVSVTRAPITQLQLLSSSLSCSTVLFQFPSKVQVLTYFCFFFFHFYSVISRDSKFLYSASSFFSCWLLKAYSSGQHLVIRLYLKNPEDLTRFIFQGRFLDMHIQFVYIVKLQFLALFPVDQLANQMWLALYSFRADLLHSLIMSMIVSSLELHNLLMLFFMFCLFILAFIWFVLMALFFRSH